MSRWIYHFSSSLFPSSSLRPSLLERQASRSLWWTGLPWIMRTWWVLTGLRCLLGIPLSVYCSGFVGNGLVLQGQEMLDPCSYYFFSKRCLGRRVLGLWQTFIAVVFVAAVALQGLGSHCQECKVPKWRKKKLMDCIRFWPYFFIWTYSMPSSACLFLAIIHIAVH